MSSNLRAVAFFDGQNLFRRAKTAFGHYHPNYDPVKLTEFCCKQQGWVNTGIRFYTGRPSRADCKFWHSYWINRTLAMRRAGIHTVTRDLQYIPTGTTRIAVEKGIDMRIGLDIISLAWQRKLDIVLLFSQDQDMNEIAKEIKNINKLNGTHIEMCSAFPSGSNVRFNRGVNHTKWIEIEEQDYNNCLDQRDYRHGSKCRFCQKSLG